MSYPDLDQELQEMATGAPDAASIRAAVRVGFVRRQKRVRMVALLATAAAVLVLVGGITVTSRIGSNSAPAAPNWQQQTRPVLIPPGSTMVPFTDADPVESPVTPTVDGPAATDTVFWQHAASLFVGWTYAAGPRSYAAPDNGSLQTPDGSTVQRGYVINAVQAIPSNAQGASSSPASSPSQAATTSDPSTVPVTRSVSVAGRAAVLTHQSSTAWTGIFGGGRWLTWKLADGRFVHAWVGADDDNTLLAFAAGLLERPTVFTRYVQVGVTLPGYTVEGFQELGRAGVLESAQVYLCPVGLADVFGSDSTPKCLNVFIGNGNKLIAGASGITKTVTVDGVAARFNTDPGGAVALVGHEFGAWIHGHQLGGLSDLDAATLAAAVRVDPAVSIG